MASASKRTSECKYDVFLSFRGEDTRNTFTTHLHAALSRRNVETFIDFDLTRGDEISPTLLKAIEDSSLSIIIFSENYASSLWCLDELLKIVECKETNEQIILPVFYHVNPSDVRKQTGSYGDAFANHEKRFKDKVSEWRTASTLVANLSGRHFDQHDGPESILVEKIADDVLKKLNNISSGDLDGLVGIESRLETVLSLLCLELEDVRIIGIWGMGGIGKTTVARAIFAQIGHQFEGCCFMANVREEITRYGLNRLHDDLLWNIIEGRNLNVRTPKLGLTFTKKRLCSKKILIVLDDVDNSLQLNDLIGDHGWFGPGSRIIITSRNKQVLSTCVDVAYALEELSSHEASQLFSLSAFKQNYPPHDYVELSNRVINYAKGIPLALKVLGCFLFGRQKEDWRSAINKLEKSPNTEIQNILKISYDGLNDEEKEIFLDVACFFKGEDKDRTTKTLDGCGFSTKIGISVLIDKCLIVINKKNQLFMHDLIQEMAWEVVRQESIKCPGKRSRLWEPHDICNIFKNNTGTEAIESILLDLSKISGLHLSSDAFLRMHNLRLLKFYSCRYEKEDKVVCQELKFLSHELRYLYWHRYSLKSLPSKFNSENLVEFNMPYSHLEHLWEDTRHFVNLRRVGLGHSRYLTEIPNLSLAQNLESIDLQGCYSIIQFPKVSENIKIINLGETAIEEIPLTIGCLNKLSHLDLFHCYRLKNLPESIQNLTSLKRLVLSGCSNITKFPPLSGEIRVLSLESTSIEEVPSSVESLTNLQHLSFHGNKSLKSVSSKIWKLKYLKMLSFRGCSQLESLPEILEPMKSLFKLYLDGTSIKELPSSINRLTQLSLLDMQNCKVIASLPDSFFNLASLSSLKLSGCSGIGKYQDNLPSSQLSGLCSLKMLNLRDCNISELPIASCCLSSLVYLNLGGNNFESLSLKPFPCLKALDISYCQRIQSLQEFPMPLRLTQLRAQECISLKRLPTSENAVFPKRDIGNRFIYYNCLKLEKDARTKILADAQRRILRIATNAWAQTKNDLGLAGLDDLVIALPGSEIPKWFSCQNEGSTVTIELPPNWCSNLLGFGLCIVVAFNDFYGTLFPKVESKYKFETVDGDSDVFSDDFDIFDFFQYEDRPISICSDHVLLFYGNRSTWVVRNNRDRRFSRYQHCRKASFEFSLKDSYKLPLPNCEVKTCGVRLLLSQEEFTGNSSTEADYHEFTSDGNSNEDDEKEGGEEEEEEESPNSRRMIESEPTWFSQGRVNLMMILVGLVLFLLWCVY